MAAGAHTPLRFLRAAMKKGVALLKTRISAPQTIKTLEPIYAQLPRSSNLRPALRQKAGGRWYSTSIKNALGFVNNTATGVPRATRGPSVRAAIGRNTATSPFASALRPTLTGGAFPRTAGGYSIGGGARYFSHSPVASAQVLQQVSAAMRAFVHSGKGQMDSYRRHDNSMGRLGVRAQLAASLAQEHAPGAYVDFDLSPTITCLSRFGAARNSLENVEFLESLSADLGAMMGGLVAVNADIRRLSALGDLPISLAGRAGDVLRVHFRGCDRALVEKLCDEVGVLRGVIHEDEHFMFGLLGPEGGAVDWGEMMNASPPLSSTCSEDSFDDVGSGDDDLDVIKSRISGSGESDYDYYFDPGERPMVVEVPGSSSGSDYEGLEGVHRFLEQCDEYRAGLGAWN